MGSQNFRKSIVSLKNRIYWLRLIWFYRLKRLEKKSKSVTELECVQNGFRLAFNQEINLEEPKLFYEKLNWLKLHFRDSRMPIMADKYLVRQYLTDKGYSHLLNDLLGVWTNVNDIDFNSLPNKYVFKASHASGNAWNEIVSENSHVNSWAFKQVMKQWLKLKIDWLGAEWHYKEMAPRIIAEKYLEDESGELRDYKFHCFNGKAKFVTVCVGRFSDNKKLICYDRNWNLLPLTKDSLSLPRDFSLEKPQNLDEMFNLAEEMSESFPYVRVDFYNVNGKIYFGEFTFFNASGFQSSYTMEAQQLIGEWLVLPKKNH